MVTDLTVRTGDAELLDQTLQALPMCHAVVIEGSWVESTRTCQVRVFGDPGFVKYALANQGYGEVLDSRPVGEED